VCGTKNFVSVRLYSAPQSHWTIVAILGICAYGAPVQAGLVRHNQTQRTRQLCVKNYWRGVRPRTADFGKRLAWPDGRHFVRGGLAIMIDAFFWYTGLAAWLLIVLACVAMLAAEVNDRSVARRGYK
jgi:hypothetical protein